MASDTSQIFRTTMMLEQFFDAIFSGLELVSVLSSDLHSRNIPEKKKTVNLLLIGKTGHGKSAAGNTALGRREFESKASMTSVTSEVKCSQVEFDNFIVNIIDSPGLEDTSDGDNKVEELEKAIDNMEKVFKMCPKGLHAFLFVLKFNMKFTAEEQNTLLSLRYILGPTFLEEHGIIIFTHGDMFEGAMEEEDTPEKDFDKWCREQTGPLSDLMEECQYRCLLLNNRLRDVKEKQKQMESVFYTALTFDKPYTYSDFYAYKNARNTLIVDLKAPKIRKEFQNKINTLKLEIDRLCASRNTTKEDLELLDIQLTLLRLEINDEDEKTDVLNDVKDKIEETYEYMCAQIRQRNKACSIL